MTGVGTDEISGDSGLESALGPASWPFHEGDVIAKKYELIRPLGGSDMAFVVAAKNVELDELVALKFLRAECLADAELVARFDREARASIKVESDHAARIFEVGVMPDGAPFLVMEFLEGKDLAALLRDEGPAPLDCASEYVLQACDALATAHAIGIVHRDVKPENVFLAQQSQGIDAIKLVDFGISKLALTGSVLDSSGPRIKGMTMATPNYMSPEQIRASPGIDGRTDIWSIGCVLYELLTGHAPFEAPSITALTAMILERPAPPLRERRPDLPEEIESLLARCLEKDPSHRFQNVSQLATALYPFAPRRAVLSVERCSHLLRNAGLSPAPLKMSSAPPPSRGRPKTVPPTKTASAPPASGERPKTIRPPKPPSAPPPNSGHPNTTMTLPIADTTNRPKGDFGEVDVSLAPLETKRRPRLSRVAGAFILLAAFGYALYESHVTTLFMGASTGATVAVVAAPVPTVTASVAAIVHTAPPPSSLNPAPNTTAPKAVPAVSSPRKSRKSHGQTSPSEEIDVGF
jgi:serine/threonine-protein kinase